MCYLCEEIMIRRISEAEAFATLADACPAGCPRLSVACSPLTIERHGRQHGTLRLGRAFYDPMPARQFRFRPAVPVFGDLALCVGE